MIGCKKAAVANGSIQLLGCIVPLYTLVELELYLRDNSSDCYTSERAPGLKMEESLGQWLKENGFSETTIQRCEGKLSCVLIIIVCNSLAIIP